MKNCIIWARILLHFKEGFALIYDQNPYDSPPNLHKQGRRFALFGQESVDIHHQLHIDLHYNFGTINYLCFSPPNQD
jgi:hypothetical protein